MLAALPMAACASVPRAEVRCAGTDAVLAIERVIDGSAGECEVALYARMVRDRGLQEGPWFEEVHVGHTRDAWTFPLDGAPVVRGSAAVPEAIRGADGRVYLYVVDGDFDRAVTRADEGSDWFRTHGVPGWGAIDLLVSDDGLAFDDEPTFEVEGIVRGMAIDPDVIRLPDGGWRMYYVGLTVAEMLHPAAWAEGASHTVFAAESDDLVHWVQTGPALVGPNADPVVACAADGACRLAATGIDWASSEDGGLGWTFERRGDPWGFAPELVPLRDGRIRLLYNTKERGGAVRSRVSSDEGATWKDEGERIGPRRAEALSLLPDAAGGWLVYFHYWTGGLHGDDWDPFR